MAKIKVKQIEDLSLANSLLTVGAGKVEFSGAPTDGGYVSGFGIVDGIIKPTFAALPAADIFSTGLSVSTPDEATEPRTIKLDDAYVRTTVIGLTTPTAEPTESNTFVTGITYDNTTGKFTYTTGTTVSAKDGKLSIAFANTGMTVAGQIFSANEGTDKTLTLAAVAGSGKAEDVTIADTGNLFTATNVEAALAELAQKTTEISVTGNEAIVVADATGEGATGKVVSLKIDSNDKVLSQSDKGLLTNLSLNYDSTNKKIQLLGKPITLEGGTTQTELIGEIDAKAFIKDGMLQSAELVTNPEGQAEGTYIKLKFNQDGPADPIYLDVTDLVDTYTADETYLHLNGFKFEHKTQTDLTAGTYGATADATADAAGESVTFNVPSFTVDAAGHVTEASDKSITVSLPKQEEAKVYKQGYDYVTLDDSYNNIDYIFNIQEGRTAEGTVVAYLNGQALIGVDLKETPDATVTDYDYEVVRADGKITGVKFHYNLAKLGEDVNLESSDTLAISYVYYE